MNWREYQQEAANFFTALGMTAETDANVDGARTSHDIDVLVRFVAYAIEHRWIVECKLWKRRVSKDRVLALRTIVSDVGADRGFLLSESGFQSGAVTAARLSNITLSNLEDLRANAEADVQGIQWDSLYSRIAATREGFAELDAVIYRDKHGGSSMLKPGMSSDDFFFHLANRGMLESALQTARLGRFPLSYAYADRTGRHLVARNMTEFLEQASQAIEHLESWLDEEVAKPWPDRPEPEFGPRPAQRETHVFEAAARQTLESRRGRLDE